MTAPRSDKVFDGSIPEFYDTYLTPLIFEPYARDLAQRVKSRPVDSVLEVAAGTGVVTRAMVDALGSDVSITATDLNQPMLDYGASVRADTSVKWKQADAQALPFDDRTFDAVVCQFSVMFFPDRAKAYAEALRVLKPGGQFYFDVWDRIEENEFAHVVTEALAGVFPGDPPRFLAERLMGIRISGRSRRISSAAALRRRRRSRRCLPGAGPLIRPILRSHEELAEHGLASGDATKQEAARKLQAKLEEVLNSPDHRWYIGEMSPEEAAARKKAAEEFKARYK